MTEKSIFIESLEYISENINVATSSIPNRFLEYWYTPDESITPESQHDTTPFYVFLHALKVYHETIGKSNSLSSFDLTVSYIQYQINIGIALGREEDIDGYPVNLFDFGHYPNLRSSAK